MNLDKIYLKTDSAFSSYLTEWAANVNIDVEDYDLKSDEHLAEGMLLINANQDIEKDIDELHSLFDKKHIPTQKIDVNGTLQVAVSNLDLWLENNKCTNVLIVGSDDLVQNENLDRFFHKIQSSIS